MQSTYQSYLALEQILEVSYIFQNVNTIYSKYQYLDVNHSSISIILFYIIYIISNAK